MSHKDLRVDLIESCKKFKKNSRGKHLPYPNHIKSLVIEAVEKGVTFQDIHKWTGISWGAIQKWCRDIHFKKLEVSGNKSQNTDDENTLIFCYPNGLEIKIEDKNLTPDLIQLLKGA